MIDWLNIEIPLVHDAIACGHRLIVDCDGSISSDFVQTRRVENSFAGSYVSSVGVISTSNEYTNYNTKYDSRIHDSKSTCLYITGNPSKFLQGHNIFGSSDIQTLALKMTLKVMQSLSFSVSLISQAKQAILDNNYRVTKIDITHMFQMNSDAEVNEFLQMLPFTVTARGDRCEFTKNTFYVGKHSGLWSFKFYNKLKEVTSRSKHHKLADHLPKNEFLDFVTGQLRAELVIHREQLKRLDLMNPALLQEKINDNSLFNSFTERFTMKNQRINETDYLNLSPPLQATFSNWKSGKHLKSILSKPTFYRHKQKLLEHGIDISKPPILDSERVAIVRPLKVLSPKLVTEIPFQLQVFCVQDLQKPRKVA